MSEYLLCSNIFLWLTAKIDTKKISFTAVFSHEYSYGIYNPSGTQQFQLPVFQLFLWNQPYSIPLNCNPNIPLFKTKGVISVIEIALFEAVWWQVIMKTVEIYRKGEYLIRGEKTIQLLISNWDNG